MLRNVSDVARWGVSRTPRRTAMNDDVLSHPIIHYAAQRGANHDVNVSDVGGYMQPSGAKQRGYIVHKLHLRSSFRRICLHQPEFEVTGFRPPPQTLTGVSHINRSPSGADAAPRRHRPHKQGVALVCRSKSGHCAKHQSGRDDGWRQPDIIPSWLVIAKHPPGALRRCAMWGSGVLS